MKQCISLLLIVLTANWLATVAAHAGTCDIDPPSELTDVPRQLWLDQAQFSFLVGNPVNAGMALQKRFDTFVSASELKQKASAWRARFDEGRTIAAQLGALGSDAQTLADICRRLDDAEFDRSSFDFTRASSELRAIRSRINPIMLSLTNYSSDIRGYATLLSAASTDYEGRRYARNPDVVIGPDPAVIAAQINDIGARWRSLWADFRDIYLNITVAVDPARATDVGNIGDQARALSAIVARATALRRNLPQPSDVDYYLSGNYLYDGCPLAVDKWYGIKNSYFEGHYLFDLVTKILALNPDAFSKAGAFALPASIRISASRWRFVKAGNGFWAIQSEVAVASGKYLNNFNKDGFNTTPRPSASGFWTGQVWRCYPTRFSNRYRFSNSTWSEEFSLAGNQNFSLIMTPTSNTGGELWNIEPR